METQDGTRRPVVVTSAAMPESDSALAAGPRAPDAAGAPPRRPRAAARARQASLLVILGIFWWSLSGIADPFLLGAGLGSVLGVVWFAGRMQVTDHEGHPIHLGLAMFTYWPWLAGEILRSGLAVTRIILDPALPISPTLVRFKPSQRSVEGLVTHANSITLTPGTLTITADAEEFLVHALTRDGARACIDSEIDRRCTSLEGSA